MKLGVNRTESGEQQARQSAALPRFLPNPLNVEEIYLGDTSRDEAINAKTVTFRLRWIMGW